jgi:hypothetical protein
VTVAGRPRLTLAPGTWMSVQWATSTAMPNASRRRTSRSDMTRRYFLSPSLAAATLACVVKALPVLVKALPVLEGVPDDSAVPVRLSFSPAPASTSSV